MEVVGGFVNDDINKLSEELEDHGLFVKQADSVYYDEVGNVYVSTRKFFNQQNKIMVELIEDGKRGAMVQVLGAAQGNAIPLVAPNFALTNPEVFWEVYRGLETVRSTNNFDLRNQN